MEIKFPLLSILSLCVLAFFGLQGDVELHNWKVGFEITSQEAKITINPTFVVWTDSLFVNTVLGTTFGNVSIVKKSLYGTVKGRCVQAYELSHIQQYYALGWWIYPFSWFKPIEANPSSSIWLPPSSWSDQWRFITIILD